MVTADSPGADTVADMAAVSRRSVLSAGAVGAVLTLAPVEFASAAGGSTGAGGGSGPRSVTVTGHLDPGAADWVYLPVRVPTGVNRMNVSYDYSRPAVAPGQLGNACDIGVFDEKGTNLGGAGFRGWSGGFRTSFSVAADAATPGYLPGSVNPGTWNVALGPYQVSPVGLDYTVTVTLEFGAPRTPAFRPAYPPQARPGTTRRWYRGDCHLHTVYSDGRRTPAEVAAAARAARLDFMVSTDHNTSSSHGVWGPLAGPDLLIVTGEEVTTRNGHVLTLGIPPGAFVDWRYRAVDEVFATVAERVRSAGGIVVPAHPFCPYVGCRWKFGYDDADAVEVWNGPWTLDDEHSVVMWDGLLAHRAVRGLPFLPAMANSDAHSEPQVVGLPQTVLRADGLSARALTAALAAGHSYLAESADVELSFTAAAGGRTATMGERLDAGLATPVAVTLNVSGVPNGTVRFITDEGQSIQQSLPSSGSGTVRWVTTGRLSGYVRAEVRHPLPDGSPGSGTATSTMPTLGAMAAMTNPIALRGV